MHLPEPPLQGSSLFVQIPAVPVVQQALAVMPSNLTAVYCVAPVF